MSLGPDVQRTCGACTFCCKVMVIDELRKPYGTWCTHCAVGSGCTIYETRPRECGDFVCEWLVTPQLPDAFRPDRTKAVLSLQGATLIAHCDTANPTAWRKDPIYPMLKRYAAEGWGSARQVLARAGLRMWLITPKEDIDLGDVPEGSTYSYAAGPDGKIKVTVHPP